MQEHVTLALSVGQGLKKTARDDQEENHSDLPQNQQMIWGVMILMKFSK